MSDLMESPEPVVCEHPPHRLAGIVRRLLTFVFATLLLIASLAVLGWHVYHQHDVSGTVMLTTGALLFASGYLYDHPRALRLADALADRMNGFIQSWRGK